jgi:hypothetical protein
VSTTDLLPTAPDADDFRALARSSPWRFRTMHVTHQRSGQNPVEGWLERPWHLRVRDDGRPEEVVTGLPYTVGYLTTGPEPAPAWRPVAPQYPGAPRPRLRPDGLVAKRPVDVDYDDPMWQDYTWVAMLDPVELSRGVAVGPVTTDVLRGRPTWFAECRALEGYEPRCSCCALLYGEVTWRLEVEEGGGPVDEAERASWPASYLVGLDVATGVVSSLTPLDGNTPRIGFENVIHAAR